MEQLIYMEICLCCWFACYTYLKNKKNYLVGSMTLHVHMYVYSLQWYYIIIGYSQLHVV